MPEVKPRLLRPAYQVFNVVGHRYRAPVVWYNIVATDDAYARKRATEMVKKDMPDTGIEYWTIDVQFGVIDDIVLEDDE